MNTPNDRITMPGEAIASFDRLLPCLPARSDIFAIDGSDEFWIRREDGTKTGIFKTWAEPIIPVLETGITDPVQAGEVWADRLRGKPLSLFETLERWRAIAATADRRLQLIFEAMPIPDEPVEAIAETFARLITACRRTAPFYNIEALVVDNRPDRPDNPIDFEAEASTAGVLDAVAMLLPSALCNKVVASQLDWQGVGWETIAQSVQGMRQEFLTDCTTPGAQQFELLMKVASLAGRSPEEVVFAANALQFIPSRVGGKKDDMPQDQAMTTLKDLLDRSERATTTSGVAREMNALIRFLNWMPAQASDGNFQGKFWTYDAACATSNDLVELVKTHAELAFQPGFADVFLDQLAPQLHDIDASSARGRFMLQLLREGKMSSQVVVAIGRRLGEFEAEVANSMLVLQRQESVLSTNDPSPAFFVGGKVVGLQRATALFGAEQVLSGSVITAEAVNLWLSAIDDVQELVGAFAVLTATQDRLAIARVLADHIRQAEIPKSMMDAISQALQGLNGCIVVRSSSFDEDTDIIGPAPGIYESVLGVDPSDQAAIAEAIRTVVASFFADKAVVFREHQGLQHQPVMAVLMQPFIPGPGGSIFSDNGRILLNVARSPATINDMHDSSVETFSAEDISHGAHSTFLTGAQLQTAISLARKAEQALGPVDIEFVVNPANSKVMLLQMRGLQRPAIEKLPHEQHLSAEIAIHNLETLPDLSKVDTASLRIDPSIDVQSFQGALLQLIVAHRAHIQRVVLQRPIPRTCHFANILATLGIDLVFVKESNDD